MPPPPQVVISGITQFHLRFLSLYTADSLHCGILSALKTRV